MTDIRSNRVRFQRDDDDDDRLEREGEIRSNKDDEEERSELKRDLDKDEEENEGEKPRDEVEESGNLEGGFSSDYGLIKLEKSHFVSDNAVELELNKIERPLETGGLLGLGAVTVNKGSLWEGRVMPQSAGANREEMRVLEEKDGLFIAATERASAIFNIQRMEQRLLRAGEKNWFRRDNGELYMENDIYENRMTKVIDVSLETNPSLATTKHNALLSERLNYHKNQYYKLDLIVGKISLTNHPLFSMEDLLAAELKAMLKEYRSRADLALIPYLHEMLDMLHEEYANIDSKEADFALVEIKRIKAKLEEEVNDLKDLMEHIYTLWDRIKEERDRKRHTSTNVRLLVREYRSYENTSEVEFGIGTQDPTPNNLVDGDEVRRRSKISNMRVFVRIYINDAYVNRTRKVFVEWPSMEVNLMEKFQFYLFSKPTSIRFEIATGLVFSSTIDSFEIEIPGERSDTLTASSTIYREVDFSKKGEQPPPRGVSSTQLSPRSVAGGQGVNVSGENLGGDAQAGEGGEKRDSPRNRDDPKKKEAGEDEGQKGGVINERNWKNYRRDIINGKIFYKAEWHGQGNKMPPENMHLGKSERVKSYDNYSLLNETTMGDELKESGFHVDVNDPRNINIWQKLKELKTRKLKDHLMRDSFYPLYDIDSIRHRLLKLRQTNPELSTAKIPILVDEILRFQNFLQAIEEQEMEALNLEKGFSTYEKGLTFLEDVGNVGGLPQMKETTLRVTTIRKILLKRQKMVRLSESLQTTASLNIRGVVKEFYWGEKANPFQLLVQAILQPRRKLRPVRKEEEKVVANSQTKCDINIQIIKGQDVPARTRQSIKIAQDIRNQQVSNFYSNPMMDRGNWNMNMNYPGGGGMAPQQPQQQITEIERVMSYVEVRLVTQKGVELLCTEPIEGVHPEWNSPITFTFHSRNLKGGFTQQELISNTSALYFTVFDFLSSKKNRRDNPNKATLIFEKHYLGSFSIPLISIFANPKMNAEFRVDRPFFIFGYYNMTENIFAESNYSPDDPRYATTNPRIPTYVQLSINLDPILEIKSENEADYYPGFEDPQLLILGANWLNDVRKDSKVEGRYTKLWGETVKGHSVFLPRFITPQKPFVDLEDPNVYTKVARFVSLIPFKNDSQFFNDLPDIWCTSQEFLDLRAGDYEEHAILLCNYFTYIDQELNKPYNTYIILGTGVPEGKTVYVLRYDKEANISEVWNPISGEVYVFKRVNYTTNCLCIPVYSGSKTEMEGLDPRCPLKSVGCLVNSQNIWVNIQNEESPSLIDFNVLNEKKWRKFLDDSTYEKFFPKKEIVSIQSPLVYEDTSEEYIQRLAIKIEKHIAQEIEEARANIDGGKRPFRTKWRQTFSKKMKEILKTFEDFKVASKKPGLEQRDFTDENLNELKQIRDEIIQESYRVGKDIYAFPLNYAFIDLDRLWLEVRNTGIHSIFDDDLEYVLAVNIFPYPNYILSVWIFVGVLFDSQQ